MKKNDNNVFAKIGSFGVKVFRMRGMGQVIIVTVFLFVMMGVFQLIRPKYLSPDNITNLLRQIAPFVIVGIGQSYVLITGNIDLSIGSVLGMSCMLSATLMTKGVNPWVACLCCVAASLVVGLVNGVLVANFKLPPFIATLGTMTIARGIAQGVNGGLATATIGTITTPDVTAAQQTAHKASTELFKQIFYYGKLGPVYYTIIIALFLWLIFNFILTLTKSGRHIYAVGSNIEAAKMSGVSVPKTVLTAYLVSAFCAGVVGLIQCAQSGQGSMTAGQSYEMYGVAASVIGGISTLGGQGILLGTAVGATIWAALANGLSIANATPALQSIIVGIIVIISVLIDVLIRQRKR